MSKRKGPNRENLEQTRRVFLENARQEFVKVGYNEASTNAIVEASGMARGSLYYHFGDKLGLFYAVYSDLLEDCYDRIGEEMDKYAGNPEMAILSTCDIFLDYCMKTDFRRIVLIESQIALGYQKRLDKAEEEILYRTRALLCELQEQGKLKGYSVDTVLIFIMAIVSEVGRSFEKAQDLMRHREECMRGLRMTIKGMIG